MKLQANTPLRQGKPNVGESNSRGGGRGRGRQRPPEALPPGWGRDCSWPAKPCWEQVHGGSNPVRSSRDSLAVEPSTQDGSGMASLSSPALAPVHLHPLSSLLPVPAPGQAGTRQPTAQQSLRDPTTHSRSSPWQQQARAPRWPAQQGSHMQWKSPSEGRKNSSPTSQQRQQGSS
ncbi:hypothetical protein LSPH24S_10137 [Lysinibacillus sphaericus]